jgi:hypothetical protein
MEPQRLPSAPGSGPAHRTLRSLVAAALAATVLAVGTIGGASAQGSSPEPVASAVSPADLLFLQTYGQAVLEPDATTGTVTARLHRATGQTMYIAEDPERRAGVLPTGSFLDRLAASLETPPYAAILGQRADGSQVLVVGQVIEGRVADAGSIEYRLAVVADEVDIDLEVDAQRLTTVTEPLELLLTYVLFTGVQGCSPWDPACTDQ